MNRLLPMFVIMAVIGVLGSSYAAAQRFQWVYGGPLCREAGRYGVLQLPGGGYIAVGESFSQNPNCIGSDIYAVVTAPNGAVVWANTYNIGQNDSATDVIQDVNGDFVICGVTDNAAPCVLSRDAFLLKLNPAGGILGVRTYGLPNSDEIAWNLYEAKFGDNVNTFPGDYIVAGSTTFQSGNGRDGFIFRTDNTNNMFLRWNAHYGLPGSQDDYFYGVIEAQVGSVPGTQADIIAVGGTNTWGAGLYDIWLVRVDGNNGFIGAAPQGVGVYGGPRDDEGRAVIEVQNGPNAGDLVVTGISWSRPSPIANAEVAMLETNANPCFWVADQWAGDNGPHPDGGIDLKEDLLMPGNVIVTGFTDWGGGAVAPLNAFLQRFAIGSMLPAGGAMAYGGTGEDWGWSVNNALNMGPGETQGYVVAGFTKSPNLIGLDPEQMYLIKTDILLSSGCNEIAFNFLCQPANFPRQCPIPPIGPFANNCRPPVFSLPLPQANQLCYALPQNREQGNGGNDGISGVESPATITFDEGTVSSYPNPIASGSLLNLQFNLKAGATAQISVSDLVGRVIYEKEEAIGSGSVMRGIDTKGWSAGTYLVRVTIGEKQATTRIVVLER